MEPRRRGGTSGARRNTRPRVEPRVVALRLRVAAAGAGAISGADLIVGHNGAGLTNVLFAARAAPRAWAFSPRSRTRYTGKMVLVHGGFVAVRADENARTHLISLLAGRGGRAVCRRAPPRAGALSCRARLPYVMARRPRRRLLVCGVGVGRRPSARRHRTYCGSVAAAGDGTRTPLPRRPIIADAPTPHTRTPRRRRRPRAVSVRLGALVSRAYRRSAAHRVDGSQYTLLPCPTIRLRCTSRVRQRLAVPA